MNETNWRSNWNRDQINAILLEQYQVFHHLDTGIQREQLTQLGHVSSLPHAVIISGLRRVGTSALLAQMAYQLEEDIYYYLNFEDERLLGFGTSDMNLLYQILVELFGERKIFILDEIQNLSEWERFVRRFMDMGFKFFITGSNASLTIPTPYFIRRCDLSRYRQALSTHRSQRVMGIGFLPNLQSGESDFIQ